MLVAVLVVQGGASPDRLGEPGDVQRLPLRHHEQLLGHVEQVAPVPVRHGAERGAGVPLHGQRAARHGFSPGQQLFHRCLVQPPQHENLAAR